MVEYSETGSTVNLHWFKLLVFFFFFFLSKGYTVRKCWGKEESKEDMCII